MTTRIIDAGQQPRMDWPICDYLDLLASTGVERNAVKADLPALVAAAERAIAGYAGPVQAQEQTDL